MVMRALNVCTSSANIGCLSGGISLAEYKRLRTATHTFMPAQKDCEDL
jgi:hypothetical protein